MGVKQYLEEIGTKMITKQQIISLMTLYNDKEIEEFKYYYKLALCIAQIDDEYKAKLFYLLYSGNHSPTLSEELYNLKLF